MDEEQAQLKADIEATRRHLDTVVDELGARADAVITTTKRHLSPKHLFMQHGWILPLFGAALLATVAALGRPRHRRLRIRLV